MLRLYFHRFVHGPANRTVVFLFILSAGCFPELVPEGGLPPPADGGLPEGTADPTETVTIATYNVENFDLGGTEVPQYASVAKFVRAAEVDLLVLQEVQKDAMGDDEAEFTRALEAESYPMVGRAFSSTSDGFNAIGVWSRFPLEEVSEILPENTRTVLRFRVDIDSRSVWFYGCHLKAGSDLASEERRRKEAERLAAYIVDHHDPATDPIVVLGDMNTANAGDFGDGGTLSFLTLTFDNPGNLENDFTAVNYLALPETPTFPAGDRVLDHIILSPGAFGFYLEGSVEIPAPEGTGAGVPGPSDHLPVTLDMARASL